MVKYDLGPVALFHELELHNRVDALRPASRSPSLNDSFLWHQFYVSSCDMPIAIFFCVFCAFLRLSLSLFVVSYGADAKNDSTSALVGLASAAP